MIAKLIILYALIVLNKSSSFANPSSNLSFTLEANLILNSNITKPVVGSKGHQLFPITKQYWSTKKLFIAIIDPCLLTTGNQWKVCPTFTGITCGQQFIQTDSLMKNEQVYQEINLPQNNQYQLSLDYISSILSNPQSTGFEIYWNNILIQQIYQSSCTLKTATYYVQSKNRTNEVKFSGIGLADNYGIFFRNVRLQKLNYFTPAPSTSSNTTNTTNNTSTNNTTSNTTNTTNTTSTTTSNTNTTNSNEAQPNGTLPLNQTQQNETSSNESNHNPLYNIYNLQEALSSMNLTQDQAMLSRFIKYINILESPGVLLNAAKKSIQSTVGLMLQFKHFILYNYHHRNLTVVSNIIFAYFREQETLKAKLIDRQIYSRFGTDPNKITQNYDVSNNFTVGIEILLPELYIRPDGMFIDIVDSLVLDVPLTIVIFVLFYIVFIMLFNYEISKLFRAYSLWGYILILYVDGRLQTGTFYFLSELMYFRSRNFTHKLQLLLMIYYYYFLLFCSIAMVFIYKWLYGKLAKYLYEKTQITTIQAAIYLSINYGPINIILGAVHRLLLDYPNEQIICLILVQVFSLAWTIFWMYKNVIDRNLSLVIYLMMSSSRICLVITLFYYNLDETRQDQLQNIQYNIYFIFLGFWVVSCVLSWFAKLQTIIRIIRKSFQNLTLNLCQKQCFQKQKQKDENSKKKPKNNKVRDIGQQKPCQKQKQKQIKRQKHQKHQHFKNEKRVKIYEQLQIINNLNDMIKKVKNNQYDMIEDKNNFVVNIIKDDQYDLSQLKSIELKSKQSKLSETKSSETKSTETKSSDTGKVIFKSEKKRKDDLHFVFTKQQN